MNNSDTPDIDDDRIIASGIFAKHAKQLLDKAHRRTNFMILAGAAMLAGAAALGVAAATGFIAPAMVVGSSIIAGAMGMIGILVSGGGLLAKRHLKTMTDNVIIEEKPKLGLKDLIEQAHEKDPPGKWTEKITREVRPSQEFGI